MSSKKSVFGSLIGVMVLATGIPLEADPIPGGSLSPLDVAKFQSPLVIPPAMPRTSRISKTKGKNIDYYEIAVRQFDQQILPPGFLPTTVWSYGSVQAPGTVAQGGSFNYPAFTLETKWQQPVRVKWINDLVDGFGNYLPHLLPVDQTLHWANPEGGILGRDMRPIWDVTPGFYEGPVPVVVHLHGADTSQESDGYPEAWFLPAANNIPTGVATSGSLYDAYKASSPLGNLWTPGSTVFEYPNNQAATTLWYHDHSLGITRLNVYAGPAGFYLLRGGPSDAVLDLKGKPAVLPGPAPALGDPPGLKYYEIPIVVQDRSFNQDGSLFYPSSREFFDGYTGPYIPATDVPPIWNPEFFGNMMVVNGKTWPFLEVEQRRYRFRFLNGSNSRFLILQNDLNLPFVQIGADGGFLPTPVQRNNLLLAPAERADVIVDFSTLPPGATVTLLNFGPDEPFGGGIPGVDFEASDPKSTGQVMQFRVVKRSGTDKSTPVAQLALPVLSPLPAANNIRRLSLNEVMSESWDGPVEALLGTLDENGYPVAKMWDEDISENPILGSTETWEIYNFTADAHPIHIHLVQFQVMSRQLLHVDDEGVATVPATLAGGPFLPEPWETGYKDTVIAYPGQVTRIKARFSREGLYVWHCHILEHEDNEMMRPYCVGQCPVP